MPFEAMQRRHFPKTRSNSFWVAPTILFLCLLCACAAPIGVRRLTSGAAQRKHTQNVLSDGNLSVRAGVVLRRSDEERWKEDPAAVLADITWPQPSIAWVYLFPREDEYRPSSLSRGARLSADIYNRSLALALTDPESGEVVLEDRIYELPFGILDVDFDEVGLRAGRRELSHFVSLADLDVERAE